MPIPTLLGLPPKPTFDDVVNKINMLVKELTNLMLNLDSLNVVSLTADHIDTGTLDANLVTIRSDLASGAFIRIDGNGMVINDGTVDTFVADLTGHVTMTGALIQSRSGFPRVVMDPTGDLFGAYFDSDTFAEMRPVGVDGIPEFRLVNGSLLGTLNLGLGFMGFMIGTNDRLTLRGEDGINLADPLNANFSEIINSANGQSLQSALDSKANRGSPTSSFAGGAHNHGIPDGTQLMTAGGGVVTWVSYPGFSHSHTQN